MVGASRQYGDATDQTVDAVDKATKPPVTGKVDVGLGYAF